MIGWSALSEHGAPWACLARRLSSKASGRYCDFKRSQNTLEELEGIESNGKLMTRCTRKPRECTDSPSYQPHLCSLGFHRHAAGKISCSKQSTFSKEYGNIFSRVARLNLMSHLAGACVRGSFLQQTIVLAFKSRSLCAVFTARHNPLSVAISTSSYGHIHRTFTETPANHVHDTEAATTSSKRSFRGHAGLVEIVLLRQHHGSIIDFRFHPC